jgi:hypothetical protein
MLPFTLSFAEEQLGSTSVSTARLIAICQVGYGIAAFGLGPLTSGGLPRPAVIGAAGVIALPLGAAAVVGFFRRRTRRTLRNGRFRGGARRRTALPLELM